MDAPDPYRALAARFLRHYGTLRGAVRLEVVRRQLEEHIPNPPGRVLDVGGGAGHQSLTFATKGHDLTILDPSVEMLSKAHEALQGLDSRVRDRVRLVRGRAEDASELLGSTCFDAVFCHGVVMYLDEPVELVRSLADMTRSGGVVSLLAMNAEALAIRPALQGRFADALVAFDSDRDVGGLGVVTRGDTIEGLSAAFRQASISPIAWYGVRVLTDHRRDELPGEDIDQVVAAEWEAGRRDPYRSIGRLIHLIGRKDRWPKLNGRTAGATGSDGPGSSSRVPLRPQPQPDASKPRAPGTPQ